jgi:hypothetical protein
MPSLRDGDVETCGTSRPFRIQSDAGTDVAVRFVGTLKLL